MLDANIWKRLKRGPQIITPKDAAVIAGLTGLQSGDKVIDAGAGSGFLAIYLGSIVAPSGKIHTYENRSEFAELARKNIVKAGMENVVELEEKNAFDGLGGKEAAADLVTLDMAESERVLAHAKAAAKMGGWIVGYLPNVEQASRFVREAEAQKLKLERACECILREWKIRSYGSRPSNDALGFTAFLVFLKKVPEEEYEREKSQESKTNRRERRIREKLG